MKKSMQHKEKESHGEKSVEQLLYDLEQRRKELFTLRANSSTSHVKDCSQFGKLKRSIARILTKLHETKDRRKESI